jgi:ribosomal protein S18 acetylase RimI-like enzyme
MVSPSELRRMQELAQAIWRAAPRSLDLTMAELAYQGGMGASNTADTSTHRLWLAGDTCRAWAWHFPPGSLEWAVHPSSPELLDEVVGWFESEAVGGTPLRTSARDADEHARRILRERGFVDDPGRPWMRLNHRTLDEIEEPELPAGYRLRTVADYDGDLAKRVAVHQRSWADLGTRVAPDTYPGVMNTWPYRADLDFVLEADDGTPVAFALGWYDEENRVAEFEPLGTDPSYRRRGLGRVLLLLGLQRFREAGATDALVSSRGDEGHPLPKLLYESVGFRELSRQRQLTRAPTAG